MFFKFSETAGMGLVLVAIEGLVAVYADERRGSAAAEGVLFELFLLESDVAVGADEGHHNVEYIILVNE